MAQNSDNKDNRNSISSINDLVEFQIRRNVTNLFKNQLLILEELKNGQYNISDTVLSSYRKRILDSGNDCIRELTDLIEKLDIKIKQ